MGEAHLMKEKETLKEEKALVATRTSRIFFSLKNPSVLPNINM